MDENIEAPHPCPWCANHATAHNIPWFDADKEEYLDNWMIKCDGCGVWQPSGYGDDKEAAIKAWNKRA